MFRLLSGVLEKAAIGAGFFGLLLAFLAKKTGGIWWGVAAHVVGAVVMIT